MLWTAAGKSATFDEPGHVTAGYTYWKFHDYRIDPENGNLSQRWVALPLLFSPTSFPAADDPAWQNSDSWKLSDAWFNRLGNDTTAMLARCRAFASLWAVALGALIWVWSRRLFGPEGGLLALLAYTLNPGFLGNGPLATSDLPAAFLFLAALWCFRAMLDDFSISRVLTSAAVMGALFVSKMSAALIVPVVCVMVAVHLASHRDRPAGPHRQLTRRFGRLGALAIGAVVHVCLIFSIIWLCYGFRFTAFSSKDATTGHFKHPWQWVLDCPAPQALLDQLELTPPQRSAISDALRARKTTADGWSTEAVEVLAATKAQLLSPAQRTKLEQLENEPPAAWAAKLMQFARTHRVLPEAYLYGHAYVLKRASVQAQFFNGEFRTKGSLLFFPLVFLVKTPILLFGLLLLASVAIGAKWREVAAGRNPSARRMAQMALVDTLPLWLFFVVYGAVAVGSRINIGHRHILPLYPPLFILSGAAVLRCNAQLDGAPPKLGRARGAMAWLLLVGLALESVVRSPNFIAYFNGIISPQQAYRHFVDSSLDWGQDLPGVEKYLRERHPAGPVYLSYFGVASPTYYGIPARMLFSHPGSDRGATILKISFGSAPRKDDPAVADFLQRNPEYDPDFISQIDINGNKGALLVKRATELPLGAGTYFVSASMLQPVFFEKAQGPWGASQEKTFQELSAATQPLLDPDPRIRARFFAGRSVFEAAATLSDFEQFRFARLAVYLRAREPDDNINYSILVYRLSADEIHRALDGPPPF